MSSLNGETCCSNVSYICEICGFIIDDLNNLKLHLKGHSINDNDNCLEHYQQQQIINKNNENIDNNKDNDLSSINEDNNVRFDSDEYKIKNNKDKNLDCKSPTSIEISFGNEKPYKYVDDANIYICNICKCTYESLRSIKAHLWKHSGHHNLSYPMKDFINNSPTNTNGFILTPISLYNNHDNYEKNDENSIESKININSDYNNNNNNEYLNSFSLCNPPIADIRVEHEEIIDTNEIGIETSNTKIETITTTTTTPITSVESSPSKTTSSDSSMSSSSTRTGGGICSVLLEVIEKLRDEETDEASQKLINKNDSKDKQPKQKTTKKLIKTKEKSNDTKQNVINNEILTISTTTTTTTTQKSKRGRKRKVNELINEKEEKNKSMNNNNNNNSIASIIKNQKEKPIPNTIVNIINNNTEIKLSNKIANKKQKLNYLCIKCKNQFLNKINLLMHKENDCIELNENKIKLIDEIIVREAAIDEYEIIYACEICDFKCLIKENLIDHLNKVHNDKLINLNTSSNNSQFIDKNFSDLEIKGESIKPLIQNNSPKSIRINNSYKKRFITTTPTSSPSSTTTTTTPTSILTTIPLQTQIINSTTMTPTTIINNTTNATNNKFISLLISLATNDGYEQYVCGLCPYVCYHLPSLKSHMWTHVTNRKFDYSLNTTIINAALDYENKLNRQLLAYNGAQDGTTTPFNADLTNPYELINYPLSNKITQQSISAAATTTTNNGTITTNTNNGLLTCDKPMVSFRCSKCGYSTINLSLLRLHKRQHYIKIISPNTAKIQMNKINDNKETQKLVINS